MTEIVVAFLVFEFAADAPFLRRYSVPTDASQCMPETAPANITAHKALFHQSALHADRKTKKAPNAVMLAVTAIMADPITFGTEYMQI